MLCFIVHESVKIFDLNIMGFVTQGFIFIPYQQKSHVIFELSFNNQIGCTCLFSYPNILIFCFSLIITFFRNRKLPTFIIQVCNYFFVNFFNLFCMLSNWVQVSDMISRIKLIIFVYNIDQTFFGCLNFLQFRV